MKGPALRGVTAALILTLAVIPAVNAQRVPTSTIPAGGQPYIDCATWPAQVARARNVVDVQSRDLARTEELLKQAESANRKATADLEQATTGRIEKALNDGLEEQFDNFIESQTTLLKKVRALKAVGVSKDGRRRLLEFTKKAETSLNKFKNTVEKAKEISDLVSRKDPVVELSKNAETLKDLAQYLDESGLSDELATSVADVMPLPGKLAIQGFILARDVIYLGMEQHFSEELLAQARNNYERLKFAASVNSDKLDGLLSFTARCAPAASTPVQQSPMPIPPAGARPVDAPASTPAAPPAPVPVKPETPKKPGPSVAKRLVPILIGIPVLAGTVKYVGDQLAPLSDVDPGSSSSSSSSTPVATPNLPWVCDSTGCKGSVTIKFSSVPSNGSIIAFTSPASWSGQAVASSTSVTVTLTHAYNQCYGTQTGLAIWNASNANGQATWNIPLSAPVTCR